MSNATNRFTMIEFFVWNTHFVSFSMTFMYNFSYEIHFFNTCKTSEAILTKNKFHFNFYVAAPLENQHVAWNMMLGRWNPFWVSPYFQGRFFVSFREGRLLWQHPKKDFNKIEQGCRFGPESSLVSPIFRSLGTICGKLFPGDKSATLIWSLRSI